MARSAAARSPLQLERDLVQCRANVAGRKWRLGGGRNCGEAGDGEERTSSQRGKVLGVGGCRGAVGEDWSACGVVERWAGYDGAAEAG